MPIPTDTFWNISRLNKVFAASAVLLMAVMGLSVVQDYYQPWRQPQQSGKVWDAALVDEKLTQENNVEKKARVAQLDAQIKESQRQVDARQGEINQLKEQVKKLDSDRSNEEFSFNNLKANVGVDESALQDALAAGNKERARELTQGLAEPRKKLAEQARLIERIKDQRAEAQTKLDAANSEVAALNKQRIKMTADSDSLTKRLAGLEPKGLLANLSDQIRATPLMQFINPRERVQQVVLPDVMTDVAFMKIATVERCTTCHVNIARKEFTEERVIEYLEEQLATARKANLPEKTSGKAADAVATTARPGVVAMPEFWHGFGVKLTPELVKKPALANRIKAIGKTVGKGQLVSVKVGGSELESFDYDASKLPGATRDQVLAAVIRGWIQYGAGDVGKARAVRIESAKNGDANRGEVVVEIKEGLGEDKSKGPRLVSMKYVEDLSSAMRTTLPAERVKLLNDSYRRALVGEVNAFRKTEHLSALDPSPVMLAHPKLSLYVDPDSKHPYEQLGCTSCHDGSGQETNFVVAAHTARPIWVDQKTGGPVMVEQMDAEKAPSGHHEADLSNMLGAVYPHDAVAPMGAGEIHLAIGEEREESMAHGRDAHATQEADATTKPAMHARKVIGEASTNPEAAADTAPVPYVDPATGKSGRAVPQMRYWMSVYEPSAPRSFGLVYHEWDWPMRPFKYLQANCVRCHSNVYDIKQEAPQVFEGRSLFANMGCVNCHQVDQITPEDHSKTVTDVRLVAANGQRKVGTDLRNVDAKLSKDYINTWIWAPKAFRPSTKMPHFFMLENSSSDEEIRRTRQEARALTEYIWRTATKYPQAGQSAATTQPIAGPLPAKYAIAPEMKGSADGGRVLFNSLGCLGCHTNLNELQAEKRADGKPMTLAQKWIVTDLVKGGDLARKIEEETGKGADAKVVAAAAAKLYDTMSYNERQLYITENLAPTYAGEQQRYSDGTVKPAFQHHGPELSGVGTKLTSGRKPEEARLWLYNWLLEPRHYSEYTVMPQLRLTAQQGLDLAEYLLAQKRTNDKKDDPWKAELTAVDSGKLIEMTGLFLRSKYTPMTAVQRADDDRELTLLATDAMTTAVNEVDSAKAEVAKMSKDEKRLVFLGKKLVSHYGCMNCHAMNGTETMSSPCANLSDWGQKGLDKLDFGYLEHEKVAKLRVEHPKMAIPMVNGLSDRAGGLLSGKAFSAKAEAVSAKAQAATQAVASVGEVSAPGDGATQLSQTVEVGWPHVEHSRTGWLTQKLENTRVYDRGRSLLEPNGKADDAVAKSGKPYDKLKMPTFYLSQKEVDAIVTFVISTRDPLMTPKMIARTQTEDSQRVAYGRRLVQKYNCVNCHIVEGNWPTVQQWYKNDEMATKAPPSLRGEGNKIQHAWLYNFLKNVEPLRPLLYMPDPAHGGAAGGIRMPSFPITDGEATAIAAYFSSESNKESKNIAQTLAAVDKYLTVQEAAALKPVKVPTDAKVSAAQAQTGVDSLVAQAGALIANKKYDKAFDALDQAIGIADGANLMEGMPAKPVAGRLNEALTALDQGKIPDGIAWPGDDWYLRPEFGAAADYVKDWALARDQVRASQLDASNSATDLAKTWRTLLCKIHFVRELYDSPYPFVDSPRPQISEERFKKGEQFFYSLQCLKCHVLGDPAQAGANKTPTAPNLSLAQRRLQRRWIRHWVQEPPVIQAGTAMPPFFPGIKVWDVHGQPWPRSLDATAADARKAEFAFGDTVEEQTDLLLDFLFTAGVRGFTGVQPEATPVLPDAPADFEPAKAKRVRKPSSRPASSVAAAGASAKAASGGLSIKGKVMLAGAAPVMGVIDMSGVRQCAVQHGAPVTEQTIVASGKNELKNVVVSISENVPPGGVPSEPAVLDQKGCMYEPHVVAMMAGQQLLVKNDDAFMHNVHSLAEKNPSFNFAQPDKNPGQAVADPLKTAEYFRVKCDVHPWMSAYVAVFEHPFFAVSKDDGSFEIKGLPAGSYTVHAWHESLGDAEQKVTVEAGKGGEVKFTYQAP